MNTQVKVLSFKGRVKQLSLFVLKAFVPNSFRAESRNSFRNLILLFTTLSILFFSCENKVDEVLETALEELKPSQISYNSTTYYSISGEVTSELQAPVIQQFNTVDTSFTIMPQGFTAIFLDSVQQEESRLNAEYGIYQPELKRMIARKNVVVTNVTGDTLNTEELIWLQDSGQIVTDKFVKIIRPDGVIYGKGLVAEEDFSQYEIKQITGELEYHEPNEEEADEK